MLFAAGSTLEAPCPESWLTPIVAQNPNSNIAFGQIIEKVVRESLEVAATQPTPVEMTRSRIVLHPFQSQLELREEVIRKLG